MKKIKNNFFLFFISILIIIDSYIYEIRKYCFNCLKDINFAESKCSNCSIELLFKGFKIISSEETLNEIINRKKSISRFGDGEFNLIFGNSIYFQKYNKELSRRLIQVLKSNEKSLLIGINIPFKHFIENYADKYKKSWTQWFEKNKFKIAKILKKKKYYSSNISRFYLIYKDRSNIPKFIKKIKKIWDKKDILIIEGDKPKFGRGTNLLDNAKSINRILCPSINAFNVYKKIINNVLNFNSNILVLISLGPTASILAYDLSKLGYQVIDIGHLDYEYRYYLNNQQNQN